VILHRDSLSVLTFFRSVG